MSIGQLLQLDVRFDLNFGQIDVQYGVKGEDDSPDAGTGWSHPAPLNVCPFCGATLARSLDEFNDELMAVGYDEEMYEYGVICGVASNQEMANEMMERWKSMWKHVDVVDLNPAYNIGDKYQF